MHTLIITLNIIASLSVLVIFLYSLKTIVNSKKELTKYREKLKKNRQKYDFKSKELNENGERFR